MKQFQPHSRWRNRFFIAGVVVVSTVLSGYAVYQSQAATQVSGDLNGDGLVNVYDLSILMSDWGTANPAADLNHDGTVNTYDLSVLMSNWRQTTPTPNSTPSPLSPSSPTPLPPATPYTFDDEFNGPAGSAPNKALWAQDTGGNGWGNQELEYYTAGSANSYLDGQGHLVIQADKYNGPGYQCWYGACQYTSARLQTQNEFNQAHGHFEARIELPDQQVGLWPAFWMLDSNTASAGEIDIFENYGADEIEGSLHGDVPAKDASDDFTTTPTGWHTYAIDWTSTQISFSIDGSVYATHTKSALGTDWAFDQPYYILLNLAVGGTGTAGKTPTTMPGKMVIDYVRVTH